MRVLLGIDLTEVSRIARALERWDQRFVTRIFGPGELSARRRHPTAFAEHVAGRFAAKEAAMKALGLGWQGLAFREITVGRDPRGKPTLRFEGRAEERARELRVTSAEVSITHTGNLAAAVVVLLASAQRRRKRASGRGATSPGKVQP